MLLKINRIWAFFLNFGHCLQVRAKSYWKSIGFEEFASTSSCEILLKNNRIWTIFFDFRDFAKSREIDGNPVKSPIIYIEIPDLLKSREIDGNPVKSPIIYRNLQPLEISWNLVLGLLKDLAKFWFFAIFCQILLKINRIWAFFLNFGYFL